MTIQHAIPPCRLPSQTVSQQGAALPVALILLTVVTMVALTSMGFTTLQTKLAANQYDRQLAFQTAEAALRVAANKIDADPNPSQYKNCNTSDISGNKDNTCPANPFANGSGFVSLDSLETGPLDVTPQYVIQFLGPFTAANVPIQQISNSSNYGSSGLNATGDYYRITVRNGKPNELHGHARVVLQATHRRQ